MTEHKERSDAPDVLAFPEMTEIGKNRIQNFIDAQRELLNHLQKANRQWFDRMQSEAKVASEFANKVIGARSLPDAMITCQEWASWQFEATAEDTKRLFTDGQKFMEASARLLSNQGRGIGQSGSRSA
jgi:uncharacterized damage-inducible protein DinB